MSDGAPSYREQIGAHLAATLRRLVETVSGPRLQLWLLAVAAPVFTVTLWWLIDVLKSKLWPVELRGEQLGHLANIAYWMCCLLMVLIVAFAAQLIAGVKLKGPGGIEFDLNTRGKEDEVSTLPPVIRTTTVTDTQVLTEGMGDGQPAEDGSGLPRG